MKPSPERTKERELPKGPRFPFLLRSGVIKSTTGVAPQITPAENPEDDLRETPQNPQYPPKQPAGSAPEMTKRTGRLLRTQIFVPFFRNGRSRHLTRFASESPGPLKMQSDDFQISRIIFCGMVSE